MMLIKKPLLVNKVIKQAPKYVFGEHQQFEADLHQ